MTRTELETIKVIYRSSKLESRHIKNLIAHADATIPKEAGREYCARLGCSNLAAPNSGFCLNHTTYYANEK